MFFLFFFSGVIPLACVCHFSSTPFGYTTTTTDA